MTSKIDAIAEYMAKYHFDSFKEIIAIPEHREAIEGILYPWCHDFEKSPKAVAIR